MRRWRLGAHATKGQNPHGPAQAVAVYSWWLRAVLARLSTSRRVAHMSSILHRGISRTGWLLVIYGVISILFGISALLWPGSTVIALAWAFGVMALAEGIISLFALFNRHVAMSRGWLGLYAAASIVFGLLAIWH